MYKFLISNMLCILALTITNKDIPLNVVFCGNVMNVVMLHVLPQLSVLLALSLLMISDKSHALCLVARDLPLVKDVLLHVYLLSVHLNLALFMAQVIILRRNVLKFNAFSVSNMLLCLHHSQIFTSAISLLP